VKISERANRNIWTVLCVLYFMSIEGLCLQDWMSNLHMKTDPPSFHANSNCCLVITKDSSGEVTKIILLDQFPANFEGDGKDKTFITSY